MLGLFTIYLLSFECTVFYISFASPNSSKRQCSSTTNRTANIPFQQQLTTIRPQLSHRNIVNTKPYLYAKAWFCHGVPVQKGINIVLSLFKSHWLPVFFYCLVFCIGYCKPRYTRTERKACLATSSFFYILSSLLLLLYSFLSNLSPLFEHSVPPTKEYLPWTCRVASTDDGTSAVIMHALESQLLSFSNLTAMTSCSYTALDLPLFKGNHWQKKNTNYSSEIIN